MNSKRLLLDGATGTELNRRGVDNGLPLWSANALTTDSGLKSCARFIGLLERRRGHHHHQYFRTNRRALSWQRLLRPRMTLRAVATAREAVAEFGKPALVAGSVSFA